MKNSRPIPRSAFSFLRSLKANNNRTWFETHKDEYLDNLAALTAFADGLLAGLNAHDLIETPSGRKSLYRIYRDVRFSKDKAPYKTNWGGHFTRAGRERRGGYYYHLEPGNSQLIGAFWGPSAPDLRLIRDDIAFDDGPLRKIITSKKFIEAFGSLRGDQLKRVPAGFDPSHPAADLLRYRQFLLIKTFTDKEVLGPDFCHQASDAFHRMRPFLDHMSLVLSTDANGAGR
jgi:uncharacterized protein (TIGR02453 family)